MTAIRIVLVDDHEGARSSLAARLNREDDLQVVGELPCGPDALERVTALDPDVILMDIRGRGGIGLLICRSLTAELPDRPVIVLASYRDEMERLLVTAAGARAYLLKDIDSGRLVTAIRAVARTPQQSA